MCPIALSTRCPTTPQFPNFADNLSSLGHPQVTISPAIALSTQQFSLPHKFLKILTFFMPRNVQYFVVFSSVIMSNIIDGVTWILPFSIGHLTYFLWTVPCHFRFGELPQNLKLKWGLILLLVANQICGRATKVEYLIWKYKKVLKMRYSKYQKRSSENKILKVQKKEY